MQIWDSIPSRTSPRTSRLKTNTIDLALTDIKYTQFPWCIRLEEKLIHSGRTPRHPSFIWRIVDNRVLPCHLKQVLQLNFPLRLPQLEQSMLENICVARALYEPMMPIIFYFKVVNNHRLIQNACKRSEVVSLSRTHNALWNSIT